jgi:hypothetical protein
MNEFEATIELNITVKDSLGNEIPNVKVTVKEIEISKIEIETVKAIE